MDTLSIPRTCGVYVITCTANGKIYVGSAVNFSVRWNKHKCDLRAKRHYNRHLQSTWDKYGERAFTFEVLEVCHESVLLEREQHYLNALSPFEPFGFNISLDALSPMKGRKMTPESRAKMSKSHSGQKHSEETKRKMSSWQVGRKLPLEHRKRLSETRRGRKVSAETKALLSAIRANPPQELRDKWSAALKGRKRPPEVVAKSAETRSQRFIVIMPDGTEIAIKGLAKFCRENGLDQGSMSAVATGRRKHYKGWQCRHIED